MEQVANILTGLIPIYVPLLVVGIKKALPKIPKILLPGAAVAGGVLSQAAIAYIEGGTADPIWGGTLGALGVALRDSVDQFRKLKP